MGSRRLNVLGRKTVALRTFCFREAWSDESVIPLGHAGAVDEHDIAARAGAQHGLITLAQARSAGMSEPAVKRRLGSGRWIRLHGAVYAVAGSPRSAQQALLAACLAAGGTVAVSHRSAAGLLGLVDSDVGLVEITVARAQGPLPAGVVVHRIADLNHRWITAVDGIPCTVVERTLVDLGAVARPGRCRAGA